MSFARKVKAGANAAITQYFYNADAYFRFVEETRKVGVDIPIVAGIMPITNYTQLTRFSEMCGAEIPRWVRLKLASFGDDSASIKAFGLDVVTGLCERLLAGGVATVVGGEDGDGEPLVAVDEQRDLVVDAAAARAPATLEVDPPGAEVERPDPPAL